jgi:type II secretory pathway predicted ATPase ExeA
MYYFVEPYFSLIQRLEQALQEPEFFISLTGVAGSGKSTLLELVRARYEEAGFCVALIADAPQSANKLRSLVRECFDVRKTYNFARGLETQLGRNAVDYRGIVLIFDDCDKMDDATLLELTKLTDIQVKPNSMLSVIMCGSPDLGTRLAQSPELKAVRQRISHRLRLSALTARTLPTFVCLHAHNTSKPDLTFDAAALKQLSKVTGGLPGEVIKICNLIAEDHQTRYKSASARKDDVLRVTETPVQSWSEREHKRYAPKVVLAGTLLVAAASVAAIWMSSQSDYQEPAVAAVAAQTSETAETEQRSVPVFDILEEEEYETISIQAIVTEWAAPDTEPLNVSVTAEPATDPEQITITEPEPEELAPIAAASAQETRLQIAQKSVQDWADAWQGRDMDGYFASYHGEFVPTGFDSLALWRQHRIRNIRDRDQIQLTIRDWETVADTGTELTVRFRLEYRSAVYSDITLKQLILTEDPELSDRLLIREETNIEVSRL